MNICSKYIYSNIVSLFPVYVNHFCKKNVGFPYILDLFIQYHFYIYSPHPEVVISTPDILTSSTLESFLKTTYPSPQVYSPPVIVIFAPLLFHIVEPVADNLPPDILVIPPFTFLNTVPAVQIHVPDDTFKSPLFEIGTYF